MIREAEVDRTRLNLEEDVRQGLQAHPKRLPPRLFYDAEGSALFEEITRLPEYYLTRTEQALFDRHADEMLAAASEGERLTLVELGAGSGEKTRTLIRALLRRQPGAAYIPVDVSGAALEQTEAAFRREFPTLEVTPLEGRYRVAIGALRERPGRKVVLFIGSSVGNFDPKEAIGLLKDVRAALGPSDSLLLGTDLKKDPSILVPAYDDAAGVTARFNKNVLARINRELGGTFDLDAFRHIAVWNPFASRMELYLESAARQTVRIEALNLTVSFAEGERIHTENSYKFTLEQVRQLLEDGGFRLARTWTDDQGWFAEHLAFAA